MRKTSGHSGKSFDPKKALPAPQRSGDAGDRRGNSRPPGRDDRTDEVISGMRSMFRIRRGPRRNQGPNAQKAFEQQIHALLVSILGMIDKEGSAVIAVTASTRGEGVSTIAASLAKVASQQEWCRVVLMDGARPVQETAHDAPAEVPVRERSFTEDMSLPVPVQDRHALALMPLTSKGTQLRSPESVRKLYSTLRNAVTLVVIDCPPVMEANETLSLAAAADGVILVVEENRARIAVVRRARVMLERAGAKMIGVVLNKREQIIPSFLYRRI
jgi:Mrp family chromosome partitioning ATPase